MTSTNEEVVELQLVSWPFGRSGGCEFRTVKYRRTKNLLTAIESNDERNVPMGLRRIRPSELPRHGGIMGNWVAANTREEALATLKQHLEAQIARQERDLEASKVSLSAVVKELPR